MHRHIYLALLGLIILQRNVYAAAFSQPPYALYKPLIDANMKIEATVDPDKPSLSLQIVHYGQKISDTIVFKKNTLAIKGISNKTTFPVPLSLMASGNYPLTLGKIATTASSEHLPQMVAQEPVYALYPTRFWFYNQTDLGINVSLTAAARSATTLTAVIQLIRDRKVREPVIVVDLEQLLTEQYGAEWRNTLPWAARPTYNEETGACELIYFKHDETSEELLAQIAKNRKHRLKKGSCTLL
jgi:hypothetical protein